MTPEATIAKLEASIKKLKATIAKQEKELKGLREYHAKWDAYLSRNVSY